ncbi:lactoylglutathione lyase [Vibrio tarriae]|uniref:Aldoketomutase n=1 Tax=Vibrio tarriae TaxID=2014742 RepID=A0AAU8WDS1_9VIBR|nr:VOC family protein [Vibrio tarriae]QEO45578.1 lactoylglutathione lyase [Vibrio cholerae]ASK54913.1 lactoylglutathione lyase [Vibrio tarriae]RBM27152.1 lactoylglutathione lyase [Vibrio tarriae]RBM29907.1 lactoylglutathione lyase [Vibrio tarriae]RBM33239.1 lactoylglutathione lyase [Vibrio tarriae]
MTKLIHTMLRVSDLARSIDFYQLALALDVRAQYVFDTFTLTYLGNQETEVELELTFNHNQTQPYLLGNAYGHIAVSVSDIDACHRKLIEKGLEPSDIKALDHKGQHLATFFFLTDPDGYKIEFLQRQGRYL